MRIVYVGELDRTPYAPDHMGIRQGFEELKLDYLIVDPILNTPDTVVRLVNEFAPDLVIHGNTDSLSLGIIPRINARQVFFMGDFRPDGYYEHWDKWIENSRGLSAILLSNREQLDMWSKAFGVPAFFWPHGSYVPEVLEKDEQWKDKIVFIGSFHDHPPFQERANFIKQLAEHVPITFVNGDGVDGRNKVWLDMPKIYHSAKFVLDISHFWGVPGYASGRYWYAAGLGGCSLTKRFPGCEDFYLDKQHKFYFDTIDEAIELVNTITEEEREQVKQQAYLWNKANHRYAVRFQELFKLLGLST